MKALIKLILSKMIPTKKIGGIVGNVKIGHHTYCDPTSSIVAREDSKIIIGNYCSIARLVTIINADHNYNNISTFPFATKYNNLGIPTKRDRICSDVIIGSDVWIGSGAVILRGATIGHGSVIAAGSVVTKDIPPYSIVAGVPAKVLKYRFSSKQIESLLKIKWWDWDIEQVIDNLRLFYGDLDSFISKFSDFKS